MWGTVPVQKLYNDNDHSLPDQHTKTTDAPMTCHITTWVESSWPGDITAMQVRMISTGALEGLGEPMAGSKREFQQLLNGFLRSRVYEWESLVAWWLPAPSVIRDVCYQSERGNNMEEWRNFEHTTTFIHGKLPNLMRVAHMLRIMAYQRRCRCLWHLNSKIECLATA